MNVSLKNNFTGFTLIEILIALAILSIAFTAIIKSSSQNIKDSYYIQQKMSALWVANDIINQVRAKLIKLPLAPDKEEQTVTQLNHAWDWKGNLVQTPNPHIQEIHIAIYQNKEESAIFNQIGYLYVPNNAP